jgi:uncharacterized membrane protein YdfJ with MMPL/SSD domain
VARFLYRLGLAIARHKWVVLSLWLVAVVGGVLVFKLVGDNTSNDLRLPGTDSQKATDLLTKKFPPQQNGSSPVVFYAKSSKVTSKQNKQAIVTSYKAIKKLPHVYSATSPFSQAGEKSEISKDKHTAFISVILSVGSADLTDEIANSVLDAAAPGKAAGMQVAVGGPIGSELSEPHTESSEIIGLVAAMIILAFTFGTFVAMGMPILSAIAGLICGLAIIMVFGHVATVPTIVPTLATMIGLGVGIDYALFMVSRYRANRKDGMELEEAIGRALATAGTAICFAGGTVVIALVTLLITGIPLVTTLGYTSAFAVITAVLAALTFLPAVLSLLGDHIESARVPSFMRPKPKEPGRGFWAAWSRFVTGHPWMAMGAASIILVPLIIPVTSLKLGQEDIAATPKDTQERQAYDLMTRGFGPGYNGPLLVAVSLHPKAKTSNTFFTKKKQAENLQTQLKSEQKSGNKQKKQLQQGQQSVEQQQASLEKQQKQLEDQQKQLESDANQLQAEQKQLVAQKNSITKEQNALLKQSKDLETQAKSLSSQAATVGKEAAQDAQALAKTEASIRAVEKKLAKTKNPEKQQQLEAQLDQLLKTEQQQQDALTAAQKQQAQLRGQLEQLLNESQEVATKQKDLAQSTVSLANQAVELGKQAYAINQQDITLTQQAANVQVSAANTQTQAANLKTQKVQLQEQQKQAKQQQQQAEQLQTQLTNELTKAGGDERGTDPRLVKLQNALSSTKGVQVVSPPNINKSGDATVFSVVPTTDPALPATANLVNRLRDYVIPGAITTKGVRAYVGGSTASNVDLAAGISSRLILVILAVVLLSFIILLMAYRSLIVGAQAALVNVLSVSAAFGVLTAFFQWGWGLDVIGLDVPSGTDPIASYVPLMMFAVLFGLSMDYQVFLLSQIEHHHAQGEGTREAVQNGLATSSKVIAAAALIMISVFGSFILDGDPTVKQFGVGLAVGVLLAATNVLLLSPALLVLGSKASWWVPHWLDKILPHLDIEGKSMQKRPQPAPTPEAPPVATS